MEYEINLDALLSMRRIFEEADEDGSGELDPSHFFKKLGPYLGQGLSEAQVAQLFMKIDADCGGTIDWEEFINFFFLKRATAGSSADVVQQATLHPQDFWRRDWRGNQHKAAVDAICCCESLHRYVTGGRDGQLRVWGIKDIAPLQSLSNSSGWITALHWLEGSLYIKLTVASMDRMISFYDVGRSGLELCCRLSCPGQLGPPLCLTQLHDTDGLVARGPGRQPPLAWGDTEGAVMLLKCDLPPSHTERPLAAAGRDYTVLHSEHSDWVTQLLHVPGVGLLSSSLDASIRVLDLERGVVASTVTLHSKGVRAFAHSRAFSVVASGGIERSVLLWQPKGNMNQRVGELSGHSAAVCRVEVAEENNQVLTLTEDGVVRLFDLRTHKCIQTLAKQDWPRAEDSKPNALLYDAPRHRLITALHKPAVWQHRCGAAEGWQNTQLCSALYNSTFRVVVSGDEGGTISMWDACTGRHEGGFSICSSGAGSSRSGGSGGGGAHTSAVSGAPKLTAMTFDAHQRRLLTGTDRGEVRCWNPNSGAVLREYCHGEAAQEVTALCFLPPAAVAAPSAAGSRQQSPQVRCEEAAAEDEEQTPPFPPSQAAASMQERPSGGEAAAEEEEDEEEEAAAGSTARRGSADAVAQAEAEVGDGSEAGGEEARPCLVLATGWCRAVCVWEDADGDRVQATRRLAGHGADVLSMACLASDVAATGDFEGEVRVWHLPSGACMAALQYGGQQFERAVRRLAWLPGSAGTAGYPLLLACGEDGGVKAWEVDVTVAEAVAAAAATSKEQGSTAEGEEGPTVVASTRLVCQLRGAHRHQDYVSALAVSPDAGLLVLGDSGGHVRVLDVSADHPCGSPKEAAATFRPLAHWQTGQQGIASLDCMPGLGDQLLLLVGSQDGTVAVWTVGGGLVGVFGADSWQLEDQRTWRDPTGAGAEPCAPDADPGELTPSEIIKRTPRRSTWVPSSRRPSITSSQHSITSSGGGAAGEDSAASSLPQSARSAAATEQGQGAGQDRPSSADAVSAAAAKLRQLCMEQVAEEVGSGTPAGPLIDPDVTAALSEGSAGRRLAALTRAARVAKNEVGITIHVQTHAALKLPQHQALPVDDFTGIKSGRYPPVRGSQAGREGAGAGPHLSGAQAGAPAAGGQGSAGWVPEL